MRRLQGGRHRDRAEHRRRMLLLIPALFGLTAAATSLWALGSPLDGLAASGDTPTTAQVETTLPEESPSPRPRCSTPPAKRACARRRPGSPHYRDARGDHRGADPGGRRGLRRRRRWRRPGRIREYADTEAAVADLVDAERAEAGCGGLERDARLDDAARLHAEDWPSTTTSTTPPRTAAAPANAPPSRATTAASARTSPRATPTPKPSWRGG